jgi:hypothetical protein
MNADHFILGLFHKFRRLQSGLQRSTCNPSAGSGQALHPVTVPANPWPLISILAGLLLLAGCAKGMGEQPKHEPLEANAFFIDGQSARPLMEGAVHWSEPVEAVYFSTGRTADGEQLDAFPFAITLEVLERGRQQYDIFCSPCHGLDGYGQGMIVQRGFSPPPSLHTDRLRQAPAGYFFEVITNGFGQMYPYAYRVKPHDRWAITGYIRALQLSQFSTEADVPPEELPALQEAGQ